MRPNIFGMWLISIIAIVMVIGTATAFPEILDVFNTKYNTAGSRLDTCDTCHYGLQNAANLNPYGINVKDHLNIPIDRALVVIEPLHSGGDTFTNIYKIRNLSFPGNKGDIPSIKNQNNRNKRGFPRVNIIVAADNANMTVNNSDNNVTIVATNMTPIAIVNATQKTPFGIFNIFNLYI